MTTSAIHQARIHARPTARQLEVLRLFAVERDMTIRKAAAHFGVTKQGISTIIISLEGRGLMERTLYMKHSLHVTDKGRKALGL